MIKTIFLRSIEHPKKVYLLRDKYPDLAGTIFTFELEEGDSNLNFCHYISPKGTIILPGEIKDKDWFATEEEYEKLIKEKQNKEKRKLLL